MLDDSMQLYILCYALAPIENTKNWTWFLELLLKAINGVGDPLIPLISDRHKGLLDVMHNVFPKIVHGHCAHHLRGNVKKKFGKVVEHFFPLLCLHQHSTKVRVVV